MNTENHPSLLESLPNDLLGKILSRVSSSSVEDIAQCLSVSKTISAAVENPQVFKSLNLNRQSRNPLVTFTRYQNRMEKCIYSNNPVAHYIEGIKQYFIYDNIPVGLFHLKKSAEGSYDKGTYLYSILMLCNGHMAEGRAVLRTLGWEECKLRALLAWKQVKTSLRFFHVIRKDVYTATLRNNRPPLSCHLNDKDNVCPSCYHYKMMRKFIGYTIRR